MKAIMISIQPKYVADILNGKKTLEIRKTMPKCDYPIDVYIYCTKDTSYQFHKNYVKCNGKVVAKFTLNKVEEQKQDFYKGNDKDFYKHCCLQPKELFDYIGHKKWYAWHIDNLEIFDSPRELSEFYGNFTQKRYERIFGNNTIELDKKYGGLRQPTKSGYEYVYPLTKAPQSWCYIEVEEDE